MTVINNNQFKFHIFNDEGRRVGNKVDVLKSNALWGLCFVILFLIIFLPGQAGIMSSLSLPISILATLGYMYSTSMTINTVTVLGLIISLGMLVDNSVVISENFNRLIRQGQNSFEAAYQSVIKLWLPITLTVLTTIAAFIPLLVTKGLMGQFIRYMPLVITAALLFSLAESFFLLPARLVSNKKNLKLEKGSKREDWFAGKILPIFESLMTKLIAKRYPGLILFLAVIIGSLYLLVGVNKVNLFPYDQTEVYIGRVTLPQGSEINATHKAITEISSKIKDRLPKYVEEVIGKTGLDSAGPNDPKEKTGENVGQILVWVNDWTKDNVNAEKFIDDLNAIELPRRFGPIDLTFNAVENGPPVGAAVEAVLTGSNEKNLNSVVNHILKKLKSTQGIVNSKVDDVFGENVINVKINYELAHRLGLNTMLIGDTIRTAFSGTILGDVTHDNDEIELFIRLDKESRKSIDDLEKIRISNPKGDLIPLGLIAQFKISPPEIYLKRYNHKRARTITADIDESVMTVPIANKVLDEAFNEVSDSNLDVSLTYGGASENTKESMDSLSEAMLLSVIGIFALLVFLFKSYLKPFIIMTTIPLGFVGISIAFYLQNIPVSFMAMVGIIGLGGIIVNSGIVLVTFIEDMREDSKMELNDVLVKASGIRLRAVVVTALTTVSGLLPTAYGLGGSDKFIIPLAMAMAWGLLSGTILTLIWIPCAYAISEDVIRLTDKYMSKK